MEYKPLERGFYMTEAVEYRLYFSRNVTLHYGVIYANIRFQKLS